MTKPDFLQILKALPPDSALTLSVGWLIDFIEARPEKEARDLTLEELAAEVDRAVSTVRTWCNTGKIQGAYRLRGKEWRIPRVAFETFLEREKSGDSPRSKKTADLGEWRDHLKPRGEFE